MAVEFLAGSAATLLNTTGIGSTWGSYSYDSGSSGASRCLVVSVGHENGVASPTGITYGGVALTLQETVTAAPSDGFSETIGIWTLTDPPTGTNTLDVLGSTENDRDGAIFAAVYTGVDQSTPVGSTATDSALGGTEATSVSINKTSKNDGVVWAFCYDRGLHEFTEVTDNTMLFAIETDAEEIRASSFGFGYRLTGDGTVLVGADRTGGITGSEDNGVVAVELLSDAGGAVTGSGTPQAQTATASGTGERVATGSGTPDAQTATASGTGDVSGAVTGSGSPQAQRATASGIGERVVNGQSTSQAQAATVTSTGERVISGSGTAQAQRATATGVGLRVLTGSGTGNAQRATVSGTGSAQVAITGTGVAQAQRATATGVGLRVITGSGSPQAQRATAEGSDRGFLPRPVIKPSSIDIQPKYGTTDIQPKYGTTDY